MIRVEGEERRLSAALSALGLHHCIRNIEVIYRGVLVAASRCQCQILLADHVIHNFITRPTVHTTRRSGVKRPPIVNLPIF